MYKLPRFKASSADLVHQFDIDPAPKLRLLSPVRLSEPRQIVRDVSDKTAMPAFKWGFLNLDRDVEPTPVNLVADLTNFMRDIPAPGPHYRSLALITARGQTYQLL